MCKWCEEDSKLAVADVVHFVADNMDKIDHVVMGLLKREFRFVQAYKENDKVNRWVKGGGLLLRH